MSSYARANLGIPNEIPMRASRGLKWENKMYKLKWSIDSCLKWENYPTNKGKQKVDFKFSWNFYFNEHVLFQFV